MLSSFVVNNFRCFHNLQIEPLQRINLIGGMNNTGKTTLLEAIFLQVCLNSVDLPLRLNFFRGMQQKTFDVEEICSWLFYGKETDSLVEMTSKNFQQQISKLILKMVESEETHLLPFSLNLPTKSNRTKNLEIDYQYYTGKSAIWEVFLTIEDNEIRLGINVKSGSVEPLPLSLFLGTKDRLTQPDDIELFSNLDAVNRIEEILQPLTYLEPRLKRLAVLVTGEKPMIHGDIGIGHLVPLPLMGEGIGRLLSIVLAIANAPDGVVLIDEIENGLHYSILGKVWEAIATAARKSNTQIFATTHDFECVQAAHQTFTHSEHNYDFRYHRLERVKDQIQAITYEQDMLETALKMGFEVR